MVTLEQSTGKTVWGILNVENTGLEFVYPQKQKDKDGHEEASFILYKHEYTNIAALIRYHEQLSQANKKARETELKKTYHPGFFRRLKRKTTNVFKTLRDSVLEILNLLLSHAKKTAPSGILTSQDKQVSAMKQELTGSIGASCEPLLEKHIGKKVVLELIRGDKISEYCGVLKDYTAGFIEIMDVDYKECNDSNGKKADLVVSRKCGIVRHLGE